MAGQTLANLLHCLPVDSRLDVAVHQRGEAHWNQGTSHASVFLLQLSQRLKAVDVKTAPNFHLSLLFVRHRLTIVGRSTRLSVTSLLLLGTSLLAHLIRCLKSYLMAMEEENTRIEHSCFFCLTENGFC